MKRALSTLMAVLAASSAFAQSSPGFVTGQVPTASQWNSYFAGKVDFNPNGVPVTSGGTGAITAAAARFNLGAAASGANSDITSLSGLTTALTIAQGGTGATTASGALASLGAASFIDPYGYGLYAGSLAKVSGGSGYAAADQITLQCSGVTWTTAPIVNVLTVTSGSITGLMPVNVGVSASPVSGPVSCTQASTTGTGSGLSITAVMAPISSNLQTVPLSLSGFGAAGGSWFSGAETPNALFAGTESTFAGTRAGSGFRGNAPANTAIGHNACGLGAFGDFGGAYATGGYNLCAGNDAGRDIAGTANANVVLGQNAGRTITGSYNTIVGVGAGTASWTTQSSYQFVDLMGFQVGGTTLGNGNASYDTLIGFDNSCDIASTSLSNVTYLCGQTGPVLAMTAMNTAPNLSFGLPGSTANTASGGFSVAMGSTLIATGQYAAAFGYNNTASGTGSFVGGSTNQAQGAYSTAFGLGAHANNFNTLAIGQNAYATAINSNVFGYNVTDWGMYGAQIYGSGDIRTQGDAQSARFVLRGTGASTSAIRLTADGNAASGPNCIGLVPNNSGFGLSVSVWAFDHTNVTSPGASLWWSNWPVSLVRIGGTTTVQAGTEPTPVTAGTVTGASLSVTADNTNSCINVSFTPPTSNTDTWDVVAVISGAYAQ